jgi:cytochrome P450
VLETAGVLADVVAPLLARGVIVRRPKVVGALDRLDADRRAVRRLRRLRDAHGPGPVLLALPGRDVAFVLAAEDVRRVLEESPEPFAPDSREKRAALGHFEPHGVLISHGAERTERRAFNERVLEPERPVHELGDAFAAKVGEEAAGMRGELDWDRFAVGWWRLVRRIVLGDGARDDHELTDMLTGLRRDANWAFMKPRRTGLRDQFFARLEGHLERGEPGSLASLVAATPATPATDPVQQVPQWLFAFDAAGMASFRALALLTGRAERHPEFLRATVLESLRLWPTTPAILRDATQETVWASGRLPAGAGLVIFAPFFHRDFAGADDFRPELWLDGAEGPALVPFSAGPAQCPGRSVVLQVTSMLLARLLDGRKLHGTRLDGPPLPATLSPFRLRFSLA